jgi:ribonuclease HI
VLFLDGERIEISEYLGNGTNNIAELTAVLRALERISPDRSATIRTDSQYSIGVLQKNWKAKANVELIGQIKAELAKRSLTRLVYTPGHSGVALNERADQLARMAVSTGTSSVTHYPNSQGKVEDQVQ